VVHIDTLLNIFTKCLVKLAHYYVCARQKLGSFVIMYEYYYISTADYSHVMLSLRSGVAVGNNPLLHMIVGPIHFAIFTQMC